ncbi:MAG: ABC transporter permease [Chloroflexia bacterium]|nr:ABC transporter permease [Chloroflexia bacterium]
MTRSRRRLAETALTVAAPLALVVLWEIAARSGLIDARFWPPPSSLAITAGELIADGTLASNVGISLVRIGVGFSIGAIPAVVLGLVMGLWWPARALLLPIASALYAIPKIALVPLVLLVFGTGEAGKYAIVAISIFFLVVLNTVAGVLAIDRAYLEVARNFGAGAGARFLTVALPGALPSIFTGLRLGLGFSLIVIVGTEFIASDSGIGRLIYDSYQRLALRDMFVGLVVTGLLGWLLTFVVDLIERRLVPWRESA